MQTVIVNCDQDHPGQDLKPRGVTTTTTESTSMSTTVETQNENAHAGPTRVSTKAAINASVSEVWYLKPITFAGRRTRVITQNFNGSVSIVHRATVAFLARVTEYLTSPVDHARSLQYVITHSNNPDAIKCAH